MVWSWDLDRCSEQEDATETEDIGLGSKHRLGLGSYSDVGMSILCIVGHGGEGRLWVSYVVKESLAL